MRIYLLRHGKTTASGTYCGSGDVPLAEEGREQIIRIAPYINKNKITHCYSSPMLRCRDTFKLLDLGVKCTIEENLREIDFGKWEGMTFDEISRRDPEKIEEWMGVKEKFTFPQGESIQNFSSRVGKCFRKIAAADFEAVLVVSHGGVIRHALCHLIGLPSSKAHSFEINEGAVSEVLYEKGHAVVQKLNYNG